MENSFLQNLKKAVETGEKNPEIIKHLDEIDKRSSEIGYENAVNAIGDRLETTPKPPAVTEEEALAANKKAAEYMQQLKEEETSLKAMATLTDIEQLCVDSILDMFDYIKSLEEDFNDDKPHNKPLLELIDAIKIKYLPLNLSDGSNKTLTYID